MDSGLRGGLFAFGLAAGLVLATAPAHATLTLSMSEVGLVGLGAEVVVVDNVDAADIDPALGAIVSFITPATPMAFHSGTGSLANFTEIDASASAAGLGGGDITLDDTSRSLAAGVLTVAVSDINFTFEPGGAALLASSLTQALGGNSVSVDFYYDTTNTLFGLGTLMGTNLVNGGADHATQSVSGPPTAPYSLTIVATVTHLGPVSAAQQTQWDSRTAIVPEPGSLSLLGLGLLGLGYATCGRRSQSR